MQPPTVRFGPTTFAEVVSIVGCFALMWWVRVVTGRGAFEIIMDALPPIPGIG